MQIEHHKLAFVFLVIERLHLSGMEQCGSVPFYFFADFTVWFQNDSPQRFDHIGERVFELLHVRVDFVRLGWLCGNNFCPLQKWPNLTTRRLRGSTFVEMMQKKMSLFTTEKLSYDELYNHWSSTNDQKRNNLSNKFKNRAEALDKEFLVLNVLEQRIRLCNDETKKK